MKLRIKLMIIIILSLLLVSLFLVISVGIITKKIVVESQNVVAQKIIETKSKIVEVYLDTVMGRLQNLANDEKYIKVTINPDNETLNDISQEFDVIVGSSNLFQTMSIMDENCKVIVADKRVTNSIPNLKNLNFTYRDYCKGILKTQKPYVSASFISLVDNKPAITVNVPIFSQNRMEGFVLSSISLNSLFNGLIDSDKESHTLFLDREGNLTIDTRNNLDKSNPAEKHDKLIELINNKIKNNILSETFIFESDVVSFKKLDYGVIVYLEPSNKVFKIQRNILMVMVYSIIISILIMVGLILVFSKGITNSIEKLSADVVSITKGNLDVQLGKSTIDEVQLLIDSFNRILASMKLAILRTGISKEDIGLGEIIKAKEETEQFNKEILASMGEGLWVIDLNGNTKDVNQAMVKILGYSNKEELMKKSPADITAKKDLKLAETGIRTSLSGKASEFEITIIKKNGKEIKVVIRASPIKDIKGNIIGGFAFIREISKENLTSISKNYEAKDVVDKLVKGTKKKNK
ncbi:PAS domain S-box protein [Candidatus Pacearchaeota archaeon]|nr:PAS domain S-box protein [Candidatus Pacearchaeota archaeon]